jgi:hypothetical protein
LDATRSYHLTPLFIGATKGHFTLQLLVERTKDFSNLIGGEQKFVHLAFTLESNKQRTTASKMPTLYYFLEVLVPRVCPVEENLSAIFMETQNLPKSTNFFFKLIQSLQFVYFNGLLPCPLKKSMYKVLST